jgi:hypothetical protein
MILAIGMKTPDIYLAQERAYEIFRTPNSVRFSLEVEEVGAREGILTLDPNLGNNEHAERETEF